VLSKNGCAAEQSQAGRVYDREMMAGGSMCWVSQVRKHRTAETGIWVTYEGAVYDITEFVENHPGEEDDLGQWDCLRHWQK